MKDSIKKILKKTGVKFGIISMTAIFLFNIHIVLGEKSPAHNQISLNELESTLFESSYATESLCDDLCTSEPEIFCYYIVGQGYCFGERKY